MKKIFIINLLLLLLLVSCGGGSKKNEAADGTVTLRFATWDSGEALNIQKEIAKNEKVTILIGPEGDFSTKEINLAIANQFIPVTLGNTRLRTETAALVACHTIALLNE